MTPVNERPQIPTGDRRTIRSITLWSDTLIRQLVAIFQNYGYRLNKVLPKDGTEAMTAPLPLKEYLAADLPAASEHEGAVVYVSDGASGAKFRGSDGSSWVNLG